VLTGLTALNLLRAAELIYQEGFNDDGEAATPPRYTTTGRFASEYPHDPAFVPANTADQLGPLFWGHSSEVSIVGVSGPTSERRALMAWDGAILAEEVSEQFWTLFDATIDWLLRGKQNATIVFSIDQFSAQSLADHLISRGHTVVDDPGTSVPDTEVQGDLIIKTSNNGGTPGRFARVAKPVLTFSAADHDDMLVGTIGTTAAFEAGNATIVATGHPAAGGLTGSFPIVTGQHTWQMLGAQLPNGAITVANFTQRVPPTVANLADVDAMVAGTKQSDAFTETATELDYSDGAPGTWLFDLPIPGGAAGVWGLVAKGQLNVTASGTYSFALGVDDGARLRIDKHKNGFSDADNVIVKDAAGAFDAYYGDLQLDAGVYDFEVTVFNSGGAGGIEMSVSTQVGGGDRSAIDSGTWELLGQTTGAVGLQGTIEVTAYVPTGDPEEIEIPLLVLLNGPSDTPPGSVYGGGPFTGFEGTGFFGGAGLNKFDVDGTGTPKTLTIGPINVTGKQNLKLTMAFAATFLDFETSDFLDVLIDPNNSGTFTRLIRFTAPSGDDKFFDDRSTKPGSPTRLGLAFQDVTYDLPAGATQLVIQIRATTTWFNEIVGFDNLRITAGEEPPPPPVGIPIPASLSVGAPLDIPGDGLWGEYWKRDPVSILVDGNTVRENGIDRQIEGFGPPSGTFTATRFIYTGNDLTEVTTWLGSDGATFTGTSGNLDDGAFRFRGFINVPQAGALNIGTTSDDGSRIKIAGIDVINNDGSHGDTTVDATVNFAAAGVYPIEITYFNGDWTSDGNNHSGNPDPSVHGGANFRLRLNGADINAQGRQRFFRKANGQPPKNIVWVSFHAGEASPSAAAAGAGFTAAPDVEYTRLLRENHYNVRRIVTADNAGVDRAVLEAADLVIISRSVPSGHYQDPSETAFWNGLPTPTMILGGYVLRQSRLGLMDGNTIPDTRGTVRLKVNDPTHPIFAGIPLNANNEMFNLYANDVMFNGTVQRGISVVNGATAAGGVVLATAITSPSASGDATGGLIIGEWQPGGTVSAAGGDRLGGHRLVFLTGSREQGITSEGAGIYDLVRDGPKLFLNAVAYMTTPTAAPEFTSVALSNGMLRIEWTGGGVLETAPTVNGPWTAVAGAASPYSVATSGPAAFFRLRQ
jgi:hypothetical protein